MSQQSIWYVAVLIVFVLLGTIAAGSIVVDSNDHSVFTKIDSWYSPPSDRMDFQNLDKFRYSPVLAEHQKWSQNQLQDQPAVPITFDEVKRLTGRDLSRNGKPYLLRAVVLDPAESGFSVQISDDSVLVTHGCLGHKPRPMRRSAVVTILPFEPNHVFAECTMDE